MYIVIVGVKKIKTNGAKFRRSYGNIFEFDNYWIA